MLFRRSPIYSFALLIFAAILQPDVKLDNYLKQGKELGKSVTIATLSPEEIEAITPDELKGKTFNGDLAFKQMDSVSHLTLETFPDTDPRIQSVIESIDKAMKPTLASHEEYRETIEKCLIETTMESLYLTHSLNVTVNHQPKQTHLVKICQGHTKKEKSDTPESDKRYQNKLLATDPTIKSYSVKIKKKGIGHRDVVVSKWTHVDNAHMCNCFKEKEVVTDPESWEETDVWQLQTPELLDRLDCTLVSTENGQPEIRLISGKQVSRPFWTKTQHIQCMEKKEDSCSFIANNNCILTSEKCIYQMDNHCLTKELTFKCKTKNSQMQTDSKDIYGISSQLWDTAYLPNKDFSDVSTKLAIFDEMKKELKKSGSIDVYAATLFKGEKEKCSKSVVEDLMYDCCFDMDGLATKLKLSKCTSDEKALAASRKNGLTHYIGIKKEKFLDLWTSRDEHVFCVFPTKLSRVFQEAAREQLHIDWGTADKPDCRGLSQEEIKKIDFSRIDLSEAFELPKIPDHQDKLQEIEERLKQRMKEI